ncbi:hypothetical protein [Nocardia sp. NPDC003345]
MADNEFGYTRWGMDWVRLAEPIRRTRPEPLLPRARSIARNNGVRAETEGTIVRAHIHRGGQASVTHIEFAPFDRSVVTALTTVLGGDPPTLTDDMHAAAVAEGIPVAPRPGAIDCSCTARTAHCVHVLATFYELARRVDENPRFGLDLQGYGLRPTTAPGDPADTPRWIPLETLDPARYFES